MIKQKLPFILTIMAMIGGIFISILFGANESLFKDRRSRSRLTYGP